MIFDTQTFKYLINFVIYAQLYRFLYEVIWHLLFPLDIYEKFRIVNKKSLSRKSKIY